LPVAVKPLGPVQENVPPENVPPVQGVAVSFAAVPAHTTTDPTVTQGLPNWVTVAEQLLVHPLASVTVTV